MSEPIGTPIKPLIIPLLRLAWQEEQALTASLTPEERAAIGTPEHWAPRDMVAHIARWRALQITKLVAATRDEPLPEWRESSVIDAINAETLTATQGCAWDEIAAESERAYTGLVAHVSAMSEEELTRPRGRDEPLWPETLGNGTWHPYTHMTEFYRQRDDMPRAVAICDRLRAELARLGAPETMRGDTAYNFACLYALAGESDRALATLREALALRPELAAWARNDPDLLSLHGRAEFDEISPPRNEAAELITPAALAAQRAGPVAPLVVDVRDPEEYTAGHIQGALNIPLDHLATRLGELPHDREVVTYCNMHQKGLSRGERAAALLRERGYTARALDGGLPAWSAADQATEQSA
jgi:rhodanese-related sulfurtransferase